MMAQSLPHGYWVQHSHYHDCYLHIHTASERPIKRPTTDYMQIASPVFLFHLRFLGDIARTVVCRCATNRVIPTQLRNKLAKDGLCIVHFLEVRTREKTATYLRISRLCSLNIFLFCCSGCVQLTTLLGTCAGLGSHDNNLDRGEKDQGGSVYYVAWTSLLPARSTPCNSAVTQCTERYFDPRILCCWPRIQHSHVTEFAMLYTLPPIAHVSPVDTSFSL